MTALLSTNIHDIHFSFQHPGLLLLVPHPHHSLAVTSIQSGCLLRPHQAVDVTRVTMELTNDLESVHQLTIWPEGNNRVQTPPYCQPRLLRWIGPGLTQLTQGTSGCKVYQTKFWPSYLCGLFVGSLITVCILPPRVSYARLDMLAKKGRFMTLCSEPQEQSQACMWTWHHAMVFQVYRLVHIYTSN